MDLNTSTMAQFASKAIFHWWYSGTNFHWCLNAPQFFCLWSTDPVSELAPIVIFETDPSFKQKVYICNDMVGMTIYLAHFNNTFVFSICMYIFVFFLHLILNLSFQANDVQSAQSTSFSYLYLNLILYFFLYIVLCLNFSCQRNNEQSRQQVLFIFVFVLPYLYKYISAHVSEFKFSPSFHQNDVQSAQSSPFHLYVFTCVCIHPRPPHVSEFEFSLRFHRNDVQSVQSSPLLSSGVVDSRRWSQAQKHKTVIDKSLDLEKSREEMTPLFLSRLRKWNFHFSFLSRFSRC